MSSQRGTLRAPGRALVWRGMLAATSGLRPRAVISSPQEHAVLRLKPGYHLPYWSFCAGQQSSQPVAIKHLLLTFIQFDMLKFAEELCQRCLRAPTIWNQSRQKHMICIMLLQKYFLFPAQSSCTNTFNEVRTNKQLGFAKEIFLFSSCHSYGVMLQFRDIKTVTQSLGNFLRVNLTQCILSYLCFHFQFVAVMINESLTTRSLIS